MKLKKCSVPVRLFFFSLLFFASSDWIYAFETKLRVVGRGMDGIRPKLMTDKSNWWQPCFQFSFHFIYELESHMKCRVWIKAKWGSFFLFPLIRPSFDHSLFSGLQSLLTMTKGKV